MKNLTKTFLNAAAIFLFLICLQSTTIGQEDRRALAEQKIAEAQQMRGQNTAEGSRAAISKYEEALAIWRELSDKTKESVTLRNIGVIYLQLGDGNLSLENFNGSLTAARALGDKELQAYALLYMGQSCDILGDARRQMDYYGQALQIARELKNLKLESDALGSLGVANYRLGEIQNALNYYNQSLAVVRALKEKDGEAILLINIGAIYRDLGKPQSAIDNFLQALTIFRELNSPQNEAVVLNSLGAGYGNLGEFQKSLDYNNQSLAIYRRIGDRRGEAYSLSSIGGTYFSLGDNQKALEFFNQALAIFREVRARQSEAFLLNNIGSAYKQLLDYQKAFDFYSQSLAVRREVGDITGESTALYNLAFVERERGNLFEARSLIESAIKIIESVRASLASQDLRESFFALTQDMYHFQIDLMMRLHIKQPTQGFDALALQSSENARARSLLDILAQARSDIRQGIEPALLERERDLQKQINAKDKERRKAKLAQQIEASDKDIQKLIDQYQELQTEIILKSPRYAALTQPKLADLKEIQQLLDADTLLLEYSLGKDASYLWVVAQNSIKTFVLPKRQDIETKARAFYEAVKKPDTAEKAQIAAAELSKLLIAPAAAEFGNKRLLIVPDGVLQYVPFAALPSPTVLRNEQPATNNEQPLIINHEIIFLPSASTLAVLRIDAAGRKQATKIIAVIADPVFEANDTRIRSVPTNQTPKKETVNPSLEKATREAGFSLPRLPGTRREATTILSFVSESERKQAIDFEANLTTATSPQLANYRIIHFATHGLLNSQNPELSGIVLSLFDEKGNSQEGFLRLQEIYNLKLPADLIVLSACQTALGKDVKGEGLIGLTRGFMYAGAQRVVASLWSVDDRSTSELMKLFYQGMLGEKKLRPAAALREAQIALWKNKRFTAPYFWSAFTIQGEWR